MKKVLVMATLFFASLVYSQDMVEISVEITEINENKSLELGIKWPSELSATESSIPSLIESGAWQRLTEFNATLKALQTSGASKVLSKPKLVTKSGTTAKFLVGGEFPIVATGVGTTQIDWKPYGIIMKITPTITKDKKIDIKLDTELSRLDYNVPVAGYPSIATRKASSNIEIKNGQTMVLAGLIETTNGKTSEGIPFLCDIPVLGALFSVKTKKEIKTNVLLFVTPKIIENN